MWLVVGHVDSAEDQLAMPTAGMVMLCQNALTVAVLRGSPIWVEQTAGSMFGSTVSLLAVFVEVRCF